MLPWTIQWIHVDTERAKLESPYLSTIVHGYPDPFVASICGTDYREVNNLKMVINYGMDKMKFGQAVLAGAEYPYGSKSSFFTELAWRSQG